MIPARSRQNFISRLPHEICLSIFGYVFTSLWGPEILRVQDTAEGVKYNCTQDSWCSDFQGGSIAFLDAVAVAAAEALYRSNNWFAVDATFLCTFLKRCPLTGLQNPGRYVGSIQLYMDEDPNFLGDGMDGQGLRKADWVDLKPCADDDEITSSGERTQLMRQCWRAILNMPRLKRFTFYIMPSRGKVLKTDIYSWEIRDILPVHYRLSCKGIYPSIQLRTWKLLGLRDQKKEFSNVDDKGRYESILDISSCIPHRWIMPNECDRERAAIIDYPSTIPELCERQRIVNSDALKEFKERCSADKSICYRHSNLLVQDSFANRVYLDYKFTKNGKFRREHRRESDGCVADERRSDERQY